MKHLREDFGITAWIATLIIIGSFALLWRGVNQSLETGLVALIGSIVTGFVVIKSVKKPKD